MGSIALDCLIRPLVAPPQFVLAAIQERMLRLRKPLSRFTMLVLKSCVCLRVYERALRYLTKNTYFFV